MKKEFMALVGGAILASITGCGSVNSKGKMLQTQIVNLTTNGLTEPLCIDSDTVFFGWQMDSAMVGAKQSAYEITVKDERGTIVWNSGRVESDESQFIAYKGSALEPKTQYFWNVAVTDGRGEVHTAETLFETSFLDTSRASWGDADWIGSREMYFDAASASYFSIDASLFIPEGSSRAAFVLGADDFRLKHKNMNIWGAESIGYVKYEIDISDAQAPLLNIYVVGMPSNGEPARENAPDEPDYKIAIPADAIRDVHSAIQLNINTTSANINAISCFVNGVCVDSARQLNPLGNTQDYNSFPNVNKIGFAVPAGEKAFFSDIVIHYPGKYEEKYAVGNLFSATEGATYAIFEGVHGVTVDAEKILVEGGENGVLAFADPSYGSAPML
ncbi:MAG: hypothetical protein II811_03470, partial [Spirochaetaceae bacterium]|nr:hypothetical protein [Spirochaetaceae bacterium]